MDKRMILSQINEEAKNGMMFLRNYTFTIHHDGRKYDVLDLSNDDGEITLTCAGYSPFGLEYLDASKLSTRTLNKVLNECKQMNERLWDN